MLSATVDVYGERNTRDDLDSLYGQTETKSPYWAGQLFEVQNKILNTEMSSLHGVFDNPGISRFPEGTYQH